MSSAVGLTPRAVADFKRIRAMEGGTRGDYEERARKREAGDKSEARVAEALQLLKAHGEIYHYHRSWYRGELDLQKIDFLVWPESSCDYMIGLQVKSSIAGLEKHRKVSRIPCVVIRHYHVPLRLLAEEIMKVLGLSTESLEMAIRSSYPDNQDVREDEPTEEEVLINQINQLVDQLGFDDLEPFE